MLDIRELIHMATNSDEEHPLVKIGDVNSYSRQVYTVVKVVSKSDAREVTSRSDGSQHRVCDALVADDTGSIYLTLWDEAVDEVDEDTVLSIQNGYINLFRGSLRLNIGRYGSFEVLDEAPFEELNLENNLSARQVEYDRKGGYGRGGRGGYDRQRRY